jgi:hypothetical protein
LILDNRGGIPVVGQRGATVQEVFDKLLAKRGVLDFRVPLHTIELAGFVRHGGHGRAFGVGQHFEAGRGLFDRHTVAHPRGLLGGGVGEDAGGVVDGG